MNARSTADLARRAGVSIPIRCCWSRADGLRRRTGFRGCGRRWRPRAFDRIPREIPSRRPFPEASPSSAAGPIASLWNVLDALSLPPGRARDPALLATSKDVHARRPAGPARHPCRVVDRLAAGHELHYGSTSEEHGRRTAAGAGRGAGGSRHPGLVRNLERDLESLLAVFALPESLRASLRTTNLIERAFRELRRRLRPIAPAIPSSASARSGDGRSRCRPDPRSGPGAGRFSSLLWPSAAWLIRLVVWLREQLGPEWWKGAPSSPIAA